MDYSPSVERKSDPGKNMTKVISVLALALSMIMALSGHPRAADQPLKVLVISSFSPGIPAQTDLERGLDRALSYRSGRAEVRFEYLAGGTETPEQADTTLAAYVGAKYRDQRWDMVIAWARPAAGFVIRHPELFGHTPRVHIEVSEQMVAQLGGSTERDVALAAPGDYTKSLRAALSVAQARHVVVVGDTNSANAPGRLAAFRQAAAGLSDSVSVEYLLDQPIDETEHRLANLPARTVVYYLLMFSDGRGHAMPPFEVAQRLAKASSAPVFSLWESLMGSGIVGGYLLSHEVIGYNAGVMAQSLRGEPNPLAPSAMVHVYDWTRMEHWGLSDALLPPDAKVLDRGPDLFRQYRWQVLAGSLTLLALLALTAILGQALYTRHQALIALSQERAQLERKIEERTHDLNSQAEELTRSNQELESFAFAISHDLRSPIRSIHSYSQLLQRSLGDRLDSDGRDYLDFILRGAAKMEGMILGLLDYARVSHEPRDSFAPLRLESAIRQAVDAVSADAAACNASLTVKLAADLPPVRANAPLIQRLFQNLLENAIKYRDPRRALRITVEGRADNNREIVVVEDNGIGIPEDQRERVFGLFQRMAGPLGPDGFGIGLALCQRIVHVHGGSIWLENAQDGGCRFCIALPVGA